MCGIAGFLSSSPDLRQSEMESIARRMGDLPRHRGPDDGGVWADAAAGIAFAHRRLSIIDLSAEGHQPMSSVCGRYTLTFNGEIYNYEDIRTELNGQIPFRGHSDTEVMLGAFTVWGIEATLERLNGMFAFAVWDHDERKLILARDRMGEKPVYCGWIGRTFLFGSELKALRAYPGFHAEIDRGALSLYLRYSYVPGPYSIYKGISKLPAASFVVVNPDRPGDELKPKLYWSLRDVAINGRKDPLKISENEAVERLDVLLREAVKSRMCADVPLGAFLSGGINSSTVVALMQAQSSRPVRTFSIGFCEAGYDEAVFAREVARHIGTDHTELYVSPAEAMSVIPSLPEMYDEPFADSSQIPTFLVSRLARENVTVSLSGDGGDELFGGYQRYFVGEGIWRQVGWMPAGARRAIGAGVRMIPRQALEASLFWAKPALRRKGMRGNPSDAVRRVGETLSHPSRRLFYQDLISHWKPPTDVVRGGDEPYTLITDARSDADLGDFTSEMMYLDSQMYLPDDILVKVDRASMAVALESRVPLLDHRLVEFAWRLPPELLVKDGKGKLPLRKVLHRYVPAEMVERPKMGFGIPLGDWLRGPLRDWAEALLDNRRLSDEGFFEPSDIRARWTQHLGQERDWSYHIWDVLMFQAWREAAVAQPEKAQAAA